MNGATGGLRALVLVAVVAGALAVGSAGTTTVAAAGNTANFAVTIDETNDPVDAGETLTVHATVENTGDAEGETTVDLAIDDGPAVDDESVTPNPGEDETVTLSYDVPADAATGSLVANVSTADDSAEQSVTVNGNETVSGTVTDGATGEALAGVDVLVDESVEDTTDENGEYELEVLNDREVTVSATTTVGDENSLDISAADSTTVDGATTVDLALHPELAGSGTENDRYEISNARELQAMNQDLSGHYVLVDDVNASGTAAWNDGKGFDPVGEDGDEFTGSFDGNGNKIDGLTVNRSGEDYIGLFGYVDSEGTIQNVGVEGGNVTGDGYVGGIIGYSHGEVTASYTTGSVDGDGNAVGGLVGENNDGKVAKSYATGSVDSDGNAVGGLVGSNVGNVMASYATGSVDSDGNIVGGLVGWSEGVVTDSYATGSVDGDIDVGGLVGNNALNGEVTDSYWDTEATGQSDSAGDATGLDTDQMTGPKATANDNMDALDYDDTWLAVDDEDTYPVLGWQVDSYDLALADEVDVGDSTEATVDVTLEDGTQTTATETSTYTIAGGNVSVDGRTVTADSYGTDTVTASGGGLSDDATVTALDSDFAVSFDAPPASVNADETHSFEATVQNVGNGDGTENVSLAFDGVEFANESVALAPGETATVTGEYTVPADADTGTVDLNATTPDDEANAQVAVTGYETVSGTLTDGVTGEALAGVDVTVDGEVKDTTDATGAYAVEIHDDAAVDIGVTTTVDGAEETVEITNTTGVTVDGSTTADLTLWPDLAGSGAETDPYRIGNAHELQAMNQDLSGHYVLVDDVNATGTAEWNDGKGFDPVGTTDSSTGRELSTMFDGSFDGRNKSIKGLTIDNSDKAFLGLFGAATDASMQNASIEKMDITGGSETDMAGGLVGLSRNLTVTSVDASGSVRKGSRLGGLIGSTPSRQTAGKELALSDVRADVSVKSGTIVSGGVVGRWEGPATVDNISTTGDIISSGGDSGGFAGDLTDAQVTNVSSTGNVSVASGESIENAGGLIGDTRETTIDHASATGDVRAGNGDISYAGGLVGGSVNNITESSATGDVTGADAVGGFAGGNADNIVDSYATGALDGDSYVGGLVGLEIYDMNMNVYWNESTADEAVTHGDATGATGLTPDQMSGTKATAPGNMDGLDYETTWLAVDDDHPVLGWQVDSYDLTVADEVDVGSETGATVDVTLADGTQTTATETSTYTAEGSNVSVTSGTVTGDAYGPDTVAATAGGFSDTAAITALGSDFEVTLDDPPSSVDADEQFEFEATVENVGNDEATETVTIEFGDDEVISDEITLEAGEATTISETYTIPADIDTGPVDLTASSPDDEATASVDVRGYEPLSGTVSDGVTGEGLSDVTLDIDGESIDVSENGGYETEALDTETVDIEVTATVYTADASELEIADETTVTIDGETEQDLELWPELTGDGDETPYQITNAYELQAMNQNLDANYTLANDVDASDTEDWNDDGDGPLGFEPIGDQDDAFMGTFDGQDNEIDGLTINRSNDDFVGLFGGLGLDGTIKNVRIEGGNVTGNAAVGGLVGYSDGEVTKSSASSDVDGDGHYVGGLVGYSEGGEVTESYATGTVDGDYVGGLVGATLGDVTESYATGSVNGNDGVGGLVGASFGDVTESYATGSVNGNDGVGGLVGSNNDGDVTESYATGSVNGDEDDVGGLVGRSGGGVTESYATGSVDGDSRVGGLVGYNMGGEVMDSYATGSVNGNDDVGGLVGEVGFDGDVANSYWDDEAATVTEDGQQQDNQGIGDGDGDVTALLTDEMTGANATEHMGLDFEEEWIAVDEDTPVHTWQVDDYALEGVPDELNVGESATATVALVLFDGSTATATESAAFDGDGNVSVDEHASVTADTYGPGTVTAEASSFSDEAEITALGSDVEVTIDHVTDPVAANQSMAVETIVENVGNDAGTTTVTLEFDGEELGDQSVTDLGPGANETVTFESTVPQDAESGDATVTVTTADDDEATASVEVKDVETVTGIVIDGATGDPIEGATVTADGESGQVIDEEVATNEAGSYELAVVNGSAVDFQAQATVDGPDGGETIVAEASATVDGETTVNLDLWPALVGDGTDQQPYNISTARELAAIDQDPDANYVLVDDVNASGTAEWNDGDGFEPVGEYGNSFNGSFDGDDNEIRTLTINRSATDDVGLFGFSEGRIANVTLADATVSGDSAVGGLVGYNDGGTIAKVTVDGTVTASDGSWGAGGIAGTSYAGGTIRDSHSSAVVDGSDGVGGLVGENGATISTSRATGSVTGTDSVGGIAGGNPVGLVEGSYATGDVTGKDSVGGLVGDNWNGDVTSAVAAGNVEGTGSVGGLVGQNWGGNVSTSVATGSVEGVNYVGGLVGENGDGTVAQSYATGHVEGADERVGGLVGNTDEPVENAYWDTETTNQSDSAGDATGLTTAEMTGADATANMTGFDADAWTVTDEYPHLTWTLVDLRLELDDGALEPGEDTDATATVTLVDGTHVGVTDIASYGSSDPAVATIDDGVVTAVDDGSTTITVGIADLTAEASVDVSTPTSPSPPPSSSTGGSATPPPASNLEISNVVVSDTEIAEGETVTVTATLENGGSDPGDHTTRLTLDGERVATERVSVAAGDQQSVTLSHRFDEPGEYTLSVGEYRTTVTVEPDETDGEVGETVTETASPDDESGSAVGPDETATPDGGSGGDGTPAGESPTDADGSLSVGVLVTAVALLVAGSLRRRP